VDHIPLTPKMGWSEPRLDSSFECGAPPPEALMRTLERNRDSCT
jgi:hypothetical protein